MGLGCPHLPPGPCWVALNSNRELDAHQLTNHGRMWTEDGVANKPPNPSFLVQEIYLLRHQSTRLLNKHSDVLCIISVFSLPSRWWESSFAVLEDLQEYLHPELLQVCSFLLLVGDHAAGRNAPLGQWGAGSRLQQPHVPNHTAIPSWPPVGQSRGVVLQTLSAYSRQCWLGAGSAGGVDRGNEAVAAD